MKEVTQTRALTFSRARPLPTPTLTLFPQAILDAMPTTFQDVVLSFLPFQASNAFVQRCFLDTSADGLPHALKSQHCNVVTSSKLLGNDLVSLTVETKNCLHMNACVECFDFAVVK
jgi:hypothetical protein